MSDDRRRPDRSPRQALWWAMLALVVIVVCSISGEIGLRLIGFGPWQQSRLRANEPVMLEYDPILGWRNKPGNYLVPAYSPLGSDIQITIGPDDDRITSHDGHQNTRKIIIVGGSFTFGWAVSDQETYPWKLQQTYPDWDVVNYGAGGYGTYQSLLLLQELLPSVEEPAIVLYGLIEHHEVRNIATARWSDSLARSKRGHVAVPYVTVDGDGQLVRHPPTEREGFPLRDTFSMVKLLDKAWVEVSSWLQSRQKQTATELLLLEMADLVRGHGSQFYVVLLALDDQVKERYQRFLHQHGINELDCAFPITEQLVVPGEGHPNGTMHTRWAECIADGLGRLD